ncbi:hypothetical protein [Kutzneria buriramensis]|uniref:Uncharacterized protein n=1 Tax=Kutzneria buriramensis TaxID=1045776 RepID=A0A3E0HEC3_9PSEU|nr:hypothetical protein [Kutzneria buriramensis]REH43619.1 hypothetical protein BCF44_109162 [Kutzneria buriramensis]
MTRPKRKATPLPDVHGRGCPPCDAAREVVEALAATWDPLDNWAEVEIEGIPVERHAVATVAGVLHTHLPVT